MTFEVIFRPRAESDLFNLYTHIAYDSGSEDIAFAFVSKLEAACLSLAEFPERGVPRDDVVKGLRILPVERRSVIAYFVAGDRVEIAAIFHGGQDWQVFFGEAG
jgi:toxin ParE1/3/4